MRVAIVGLGYVGAVTGACLAEGGHDVSLVDINQTKIDQLNAGESPIAELGLGDLVRSNVARGRLSATDNLAAAAKDAEAVIVCVGTPSGGNGDVYLDDVLTVCDQLAAALATAAQWQLVLITSTVPPGTVVGHVIPRLEAGSGKVCGRDFGVAFSPEFLREGTAIADFTHPTKTVIGADDERTVAAASALFAPYSGRLLVTSVATAEMAKFTDNAWHALKVAFANEIGRVCDAVGAGHGGIDSQEVLAIFKTDTRLNISTAYLTPGFAFGGSCLPKDLRTLTYRARSAGAYVPVLESILPSNRGHVEHALAKIEKLGARRIALLGLAFKSGTDDLRESPMVELAERLLGKGHTVRIHDEHVNLERLVGANRAYVLGVLPHLASLLDDHLERVLSDADAIVVGQSSPLYAGVTAAAAGRPVLDLTGVARPRTPEPADDATIDYRGLTW